MNQMIYGGIDRPHHIIRAWHLFIFFVLCRIPYLINLYPGSMLYDSASSIAQFYGIITHTQSVTTAPELLYTDHHLILFTFFMGGFIKLGELLGNQNFGFFLYILLQVVVSNLILVYSLMTIRDDVSSVAFGFAVLLYALLPHISVWQVTMSKDSYFSVLVLLFCCCVYRALHNDLPPAQCRHLKFLLYMSTLLCCFTKHQGAYLIIVTSIVLLIAYRKRFIRIAAVLMLTGIFYLTVYSNLILPLCHVSKTGKQEAMGALFQQTARYTVDYPDDITDEEKEAIDRLLPFERLTELYNPYLQDPVKFEFNQGASRDDILNYIRAWSSMFFRHPDSYIKATLDTCGEYFWAFAHSMQYRLPPIQKNSIIIANPILNLYNSASESSLNAMDERLSYLSSLPGLHFFFCYPCYSWSFIIFFLMLLFGKKTAAVVALTPVALSLCVLLITPDLEYRYFLPIIYAWPAAAALAFTSSACPSILWSPFGQRSRKRFHIAAATAVMLLLFIFCRETDPTTVNSVSVPDTVYSEVPVVFTVETSAGAKYLFMYTENGIQAGSWTAIPNNSSVIGSIRRWTVEKRFSKPGDRIMTFRAGETKSPTDSSKTAYFSLVDTSSVISVEASDNVAKGAETIFTVKTSSESQYLMMYMENGNLVKQWRAGEANSIVDGDIRVWTVRYVFKGTGNRTMLFRTSMTSTPADSGVSIDFTIF